MGNELLCWTVLFPNKQGATFDFDIFAKTLIQYVEILGDNCVKYEVRKGLGAPGVPATHFICIANFWIKSREQLVAALSDARMREIVEQLNSCTNIQSLRQLDTVIV